MAYPGDPFAQQQIPQNYKKAHPALPNLMGSQFKIARFGDVFQAVNNQTIPEGFYNKAIEINTERSKTHFQGILRHPSSNILYLSGSDKRSHTSQLFVLEIAKFLESASPAHREALTKGPLGSNVVVGKPDATKDRLLSVFKFSEDYWHGGGMDTEGEILVMPLENAEKNKSKISFLCIRDAKNPVFFSKSDILRTNEIAGAAALIRLKNGKYLCGVWVDSDQKGHRLDLYVSRTDDIAQGFLYHDKYVKHTILWKDKQHWLGNRMQRNFQNFQFFRDENGDICCFATDNKFKTAPALPGLNRTHLLKLIIDEDALDGSHPDFRDAKVAQINEMKINNVRMMYNFNAGASFYITPEKELALYAVSHWRNRNDCISMAEFYPPLRDTGNHITNLDFARVELYDDANFGINAKGYMMQRCLKIIGRYNNVLRDFNDIRVHGKRFGDKINSLKYILPQNYSLWLYEHDNFKGKSKEIRGNGKYQEVKDLKKISEIGGEVSSLRIRKN